MALTKIGVIVLTKSNGLSITCVNWHLRGKLQRKMLVLTKSKWLSRTCENWHLRGRLQQKMLELTKIKLAVENLSKLVSRSSRTRRINIIRMKRSQQAPPVFIHSSTHIHRYTFREKRPIFVVVNLLT